jgi:hypothetical protein
MFVSLELTFMFLFRYFKLWNLVSVTLLGQLRYLQQGWLAVTLTYAGKAIINLVMYSEL